MKKKSIILVDNSPLVSGMLRRVIDDVGDLEIVAEVEDISQYPAILSKRRLDGPSCSSIQMKRCRKLLSRSSVNSLRCACW